MTARCALTCLQWWWWWWCWCHHHHHHLSDVYSAVTTTHTLTEWLMGVMWCHQRTWHTQTQTPTCSVHCRLSHGTTSLTHSLADDTSPSVPPTPTPAPTLPHCQQASHRRHKQDVKCKMKARFAIDISAGRARHINISDCSAVYWAAGLVHSTNRQTIAACYTTHTQLVKVWDIIIIIISIDRRHGWRPSKIMI